MRTSTFRLVATLLVAGGFAAGNSRIATAADATAHADPLSVSLYCDELNCDAYATGGSGSGYTFSWAGAVENYESGSSSSASYMQCGGVTTPQYRRVGVTVTDGAGATASAQALGQCNTTYP